MPQSCLGRWFYLAAVVVLLTSMALSCSNRGEAENSYNRGVAYFNKGEYDQAIADCTEAIRLHPQNPSFYLSRAKAYRALGDDAKATKDEEKARELSK